jgi:hypothetical protein
VLRWVALELCSAPNNVLSLWSDAQLKCSDFWMHLLTCLCAPILSRRSALWHPLAVVATSIGECPTSPTRPRLACVAWATQASATPPPGAGLTPCATTPPSSSAGCNVGAVRYTPQSSSCLHPHLSPSF